MNDHRDMYPTAEAIDYLRKVRRNTMTASEVPAGWRQHRVSDGVVARSCNGLDHPEVMGCWAFYPDQLSEAIHD